MFKCVKTSAGTMNVPETVYLPVTAEEKVEEGEALVLSDGKLTKASTSVEYIAEKTGIGGTIPCLRVTKDAVFECSITSALTDGELGDLLLLSSDGQNVGEANETGKAQIVDFAEGKAVGDKIRVRFI